MKYWAILIALGMGWGMTQPFSKIAVSGGYRDFGLLFWQSVIGLLCLAPVVIWRRRPFKLGVDQGRVILAVALAGTIVSGAFSFKAYVHLDSGIMSILISMVPIFSLPMALVMRVERWQARRMLGLVLGFAGVLLLMLPGQAALGAAALWYIPLGLVAPLLYAFEGNFVARYGTAGLDPFQVLFGVSVVGVVLTGPMALMTGTWIDPFPPYGAPDLALIASSLINVFVYAGYVWLIAAAGAVFAVQVGYFVTIGGVFWARLFLGESYSLWVWAALALVLAGVFMVQPKPGIQLAPTTPDGQN